MVTTYCDDARLSKKRIKSDFRVSVHSYCNSIPERVERVSAVKQTELMMSSHNDDRRFTLSGSTTGHDAVQIPEQRCLEPALTLTSTKSGAGRQPARETTDTEEKV